MFNEKLPVRVLVCHSEIAEYICEKLQGELESWLSSGALAGVEEVLPKDLLDCLFALTADGNVILIFHSRVIGDTKQFVGKVESIRGHLKIIALTVDADWAQAVEADTHIYAEAGSEAAWLEELLQELRAQI